MTYHVVDEATKAQSSGAGFSGRAARLGFVLNESSPRVCTSKNHFLISFLLFSQLRALQVLENCFASEVLTHPIFYYSQ